MSQFQDYFTNPQYIGALNAISEHDKSAGNMGVVYVEDASDVGFWQIFIDAKYPKQYSIKLASKEGKNSTGKRFLETLYPTLNSQALVAIDADYDYIKARFDDSHPFNDNQYILHTFGFSRESAVIESASLQEFFKRCRHTVEHKVAIDDFLHEFSRIAYDGLVKFITALVNPQYQEYIPSDFHHCFKITNKTLLNTVTLTLETEPLVEVNDKLTHLFDNQSFVDTDLHKTKQALTQLGIHHNNAYRFICGHTLENLVKKVHKSLIDELYKKEIHDIKEKSQSEEIADRMKQFKNSFKPKFSLETFFTNYPINDNDDVHKLVFQRVQALTTDDV